MEEVAQEEAGLRKVPASEILAKIEKGEPVEYDHVIICGDLDLTGLDLPLEKIDRTIYEVAALKLPETIKKIASSIYIQDSKIEGSLNFVGIFLASISFKDSNFCKYINFTGALFKDNVNFRGAWIEGDAAFYGVKFCGTANFMGVRFNMNSRFKNAIFEGRALFGGDGTIKGPKFRYFADFKGASFEEEAYFALAQFEMDAYFDEGVHFNKEANFRSAQFNGEANFDRADFNGNAFFDERAKFVLDTYFTDTRFNSDAHFIEVIFLRDANFMNAEFLGNVFMGMDIYQRKSKFYGATNFKNSLFKKRVHIKGADFLGNVISLSFRGAEFEDPLSQESVCRLAKRILETNGDKEEADYHFYKEMEAKRVRKSWYKRYPEYIFIQLIFGYGVHPPRLMASWIFIILAFGMLYWIGSGINGAAQLLDCMKFSFASAIAPGYIANTINPGYTGYQPTPIYQAMAGLEAILGTFMWAAFIATFARKYMR